VIARLAGLAIDARFAIPAAMPGALEPVARARAARWIAANALATRGIQLAIEGAPPSEPSILVMRAAGLSELLAAIAAIPVLVDPASLPCRWRLALRALGLPALDRPAESALSGGASVLTSGGRGCELAVDRELRGFRVRLAPPERTLPA
jgi:hypothetical protein